MRPPSSPGIRWLWMVAVSCSVSDHGGTPRCDRVRGITFLQSVHEPGETPLNHVADVARIVRAMGRAGVEHELGLDTAIAQGAVEIAALIGRDIPVRVAVQQ